MQERYVILVWHQAGGRDNSAVYYLWADEDDNTLVFSSPSQAKQAWNDTGMREIHAGTVLDVTATRNYWI